jgi:hypothetical protein
MEAGTRMNKVGAGIIVESGTMMEAGTTMETGTRMEARTIMEDGKRGWRMENENGKQFVFSAFCFLIFKISKHLSVSF